MSKKNIIVGTLTLFILGLMIYLPWMGTVFQGGEQSRVIRDIGENPSSENLSKTVSKNSTENEELQRLQDQAGAVKSFTVSIDYRRKCASCHGINGRGVMGPSLIGQSSETIYAKLIDYKMGRLENPVMKGLVMNLTKEELKNMADEIGTFGQKVK